MVRTVVPSAVAAARRMFSVAPTLGKDRVRLAPCIRPETVQSKTPCSSRMESPSFRRACRWRSMGRGPSSQPPGKLSFA